MLKFKSRGPVVAALTRLMAPMRRPRQSVFKLLAAPISDADEFDRLEELRVELDGPTPADKMLPLRSSEDTRTAAKRFLKFYRETAERPLLPLTAEQVTERYHYFCRWDHRTPASWKHVLGDLVKVGVRRFEQRGEHANGAPSWTRMYDFSGKRTKVVRLKKPKRKKAAKPKKLAPVEAPRLLMVA